MKFTVPTLFVLLFFNMTSLCHGHENLSTSPKVVVSITPFYALVAAVMEGVGAPQLLVKPGASPHQYALKSSEIQLLQNADILFWAGPTLETFLVKPLQTIAEERPFPIIIEFDKTPGLLLLPLRQSPSWDLHVHSNNPTETHSINNTDIDMHFWLDPQNAMILTNRIVQALATFDPAHAHQYHQNGKTLQLRLRQLDTHIAAQLAGVKTIPYIVFHDAYQYFEHRYGLNGVGAISVHPEIPPSAKRLKTIREIIHNTNAHCVFTEPQFPNKLAQSIIQDTPIKTGELDPLGLMPTNDANGNGYFKLLENLSNSMKRCLSGS